MPFDYANLKEYNFDFDELRKHLYKHFRLNFKHFDQWIDGWMKVFKNAEKDTAIQVKNLTEKGFPAFEIFTQNAHLGRVTFKFNFIVEGAKEYVKNNNIKPKKISASKFSTQIKWSKESGTTSNDINTPIFLTTLPLEDYMYVVIDGNHRLTKLLARGATEVSCIDIQPIEILNNNILIFTIDKAMYAFLIEAKSFQLHLNQNIHQHEEIFKSSHINNALKVFNVD